MAILPPRGIATHDRSKDGATGAATAETADRPRAGPGDFDMNQPQPALRPAPRSDDPQELAREILERLTYRIGKDPKVAKPHDWLMAAILVTRDRAIERWMVSTRATYET